jgi:hypothetical protein
MVPEGMGLRKITKNGTTKANHEGTKNTKESMELYRLRAPSR